MVLGLNISRLVLQVLLKLDKKSNFRKSFLFLFPVLVIVSVLTNNRGQAKGMPESAFHPAKKKQNLAMPCF